MYLSLVPMTYYPYTSSEGKHYIWARFEPKIKFRATFRSEADVGLVGLRNASSGKLVYLARYDMSHLFHPRGTVRTGCPLDSAGWLTSGGSLVLSYPGILAAPQTGIDAVVRAPRVLS